MNAPFPATVSFARLAVKRLMTPNYEANEGCFRPLKVISPPGSMFNANPPAPVFLYGYGPFIMGELVMKALAQAMPERAVAHGGGNECAIVFSGNDPKRGGYFAGADIDGVGQGASLEADGESALVPYYAGDSRNTPIEVLESKYPIQTMRYELRQDSCGAGRFRGGLGVVKHWKALTDLRCITVVEQTKAPPTGLFGGSNALPNVSILNAGSAAESRVGKQSDACLRVNAEWHLLTGGGGGWGDPYERDAHAVLEDVVQGYVSLESAEKDYGVVLQRTTRKLCINDSATLALRAGKRC